MKHISVIILAIFLCSMHAGASPLSIGDAFKGFGKKLQETIADPIQKTGETAVNGAKDGVTTYVAPAAVALGTGVASGAVSTVTGGGAEGDAAAGSPQVIVIKQPALSPSAQAPAVQARSLDTNPALQPMGPSYPGGAYDPNGMAYPPYDPYYAQYGPPEMQPGYPMMPPPPMGYEGDPGYFGQPAIPMGPYPPQMPQAPMMPPGYGQIENPYFMPPYPPQYPGPQLPPQYPPQYPAQPGLVPQPPIPSQLQAQPKSPQQTVPSQPQAQPRSLPQTPPSPQAPSVPPPSPPTPAARANDPVSPMARPGSNKPVSPFRR